MADRLTTLPDIEAACWRELVAAPQQRGHGWRVMTLATVANTAEGEPLADARSVVLREVQAPQRQLIFYTDARSGKARQLQACPRGTLVLWSAALGWQLRLRVALTLQTSGLTVSSRWAQVKLTPGAQDYISPLPPGTGLAVPDTHNPQRDSRDHFAMVTAEVLAMDWLELHASGHRRAAFDRQGACWLAP